MLRKIDFAREGLACTDLHGTEDCFALGGDLVSAGGLDDEVQPLKSSVAVEEQFLARVVGDCDDSDDRFPGEMLLFRDLERACELGVGGSGAKKRGGDEFQTPVGHFVRELEQSPRRRQSNVRFP